MSNITRKIKATPQDAVGSELASVLPATEKPWYRTSHLVKLNLLLLIPLLSSAGVGYDGSMMNGLQTLPQWRHFFGNPPAPLLGAINAIYPVSKIIGLYPAQWLSDRYGRKLPFMMGLVVMLIGPALQASSHNLALFISSRAIIGLATVFLQMSCPILVTELAYPTHRAKVTSLYNTFFYFGAIFAAWSTFGTFRLHSTWAWRIPSLLQAAIPFVQALGVWWVPESPRWLVANGKVEQARTILVKYHAGGDTSSVLVDHEIATMESAIQAERHLEGKISWLSLFKSAPNRKRVLIAFFLGFAAQWNGISVVTYYLTLVLNTIGITAVADQALLNGLLQIFNFVTAVFVGAMMVDKFGRRRLFLVSTGGLLSSYVAWTALTSYFVKSHDAMAGRAVLAFIFLAYFFYSMAWTPLPLAYTVEIFPYGIRSRGLAINFGSTYLGLVTAQLIHPVALRAIGAKYYIVFCCLLAGIFAFIWFLMPETKGRSLEEITEIFEGRVATDLMANASKKDNTVDEVEDAKDVKSSVKTV